MANAPIDVLYRATDAPLRGVTNTPPTGSITEFTTIFPNTPKSRRQRKPVSDKTKQEEKDHRQPPGEDHLVDDYA